MWHVFCSFKYQKLSKVKPQKTSKLQNFKGVLKVKWAKAREKTIQKWRELRVIAGVYSRRAFMERVTEICALCQMAQTIADMEHSKDRCPYCLGHIQYGGCQGLINELAAATLDADWDKVRAIIDDAINFLEHLDIPEEANISNEKNLLISVN
jgi:PHP family Zn ribbon phosphoesterase